MKNLLFALLFLPLITFAQTGPKMEIVGGDNINTGTHRRGVEVVYEVQFKNVGDQDLQITGVSTSCGCSSALAGSDAMGTEHLGIGAGKRDLADRGRGLALLELEHPGREPQNAAGNGHDQIFLQRAGHGYRNKIDDDCHK